MVRRAPILAGAIGVAALAGFIIAGGLGSDLLDEIDESLPGPGTRSVSATVETEPVPSEGDAADDPAIWIDPDRPERSTVIGTDKQGGIAVYDLAGRELQYRPDGRINNVDLREGFALGSRTVAIVAATNRSSRTVALYRVDPGSRELVEVAPELADPNLVAGGICLYGDPGDERFGLFVTGGNGGEVEHWTLTATAEGVVTAERVGAFGFDSPTEACVVDERSATAYFAEEATGIWSMPIEPGAEDGRRLVASTEERHLTADVEGLAIARFSERSAQLVASSQGSDSFVVYRLGGEHEYLYDFEVVEGRGADRAVETDRIEVTTANLGREFPRGLLVVQDGDNDDGNQNFKLIPLCPGALVCPS